MSRYFLPFGDRGGRGSYVSTAFVLSGGGNRGVAQIGMLRALLEAGIRPDVVIGTSVGALNGAALAGDPSLASLERLEAGWLSLRSDEVFPGGRLARGWRLATGADHLWPARGLDALVGRLATEDFADLVLPLRVVACDLNTGTEVVLAAGRLRPALLASAALPGVFPPVEHDGMVLVDGGVVDNIPITHALAGPPTHAYVCDASGGVEDGQVHSSLEVLLRSYAISRMRSSALTRESVAGRSDVTLLPRVPDRRHPFDFSGGEALIAVAHAATAAFLAERARRAGRPGRAGRAGLTDISTRHWRSRSA